MNGIRHKGCSLLNGKSRLQRKVEDYISSKYKYYTLLHENNCTLIPKSPITNYNLYFDNEIKELKFIIEVHGLQHYKTCTWDKKTAKRDNVCQEDVFKKRQFYDLYKKDYALNHGYSYLEIPYWTEIDGSYKKLIDDKIKEIVKEVTWQKIKRFLVVYVENFLNHVRTVSHTQMYLDGEILLVQENVQQNMLMILLHIVNP